MEPRTGHKSAPILSNIAQSFKHIRVKLQNKLGLFSLGSSLALESKSKKISNDQELIQSDPISCPQNQFEFRKTSRIVSVLVYACSHKHETFFKRRGPYCLPTSQISFGFQFFNTLTLTQIANPKVKSYIIGERALNCNPTKKKKRVIYV